MFEWVLKQYIVALWFSLMPLEKTVETQLYEDLMMNYNHKVRPTLTPGDQTTVSVYFVLGRIENLVGTESCTCTPFGKMESLVMNLVLLPYLSLCSNTPIWWKTLSMRKKHIIVPNMFSCSYLFTE